MKHSKTLSFNIDLHLVIAILFAIIIGMIAMWRPWESTKIERKITINGSATVESTPDEFSFSPYFERTGTNASALKNELNTFGAKLIDEVVKLGVKKDDITLNSSGYGRPEIAPVAPDGGASNNDDGKQTITLSVSIKAPTKEIAQKVQDYLAKTDAKGSLTSQPIFSQTKRQNLEDEARDKAIEDARTKAERSAKHLSVTVGKVIEVKEAGGMVYPLYAKGATEADTSISSLPVTPGSDSVSSNVEVIFEIK